MMIQELESARVRKWEEADDSSAPGATTVTLAPGHTDAMTRFSTPTPFNGTIRQSELNEYRAPFTP